VRYPKPNYLYSVWLTLRTIAQASGEGDSFGPERSLADTMACLEAAAGRPKQEFESHEVHEPFFAKVAALGHGIAARHCFGNGNKRAAFISMLQMMHANGWTWNAPPDIVAFVMLRTASNIGRMDVPEIAAFIGAYAEELTGKTLESYRHMSDGMVNKGLAEVVYPEDVWPLVDVFPAEVSVQQEVYEAASTAALRKHVDLMDAEETEEFRKTFRWPEEMNNKIRRWYARVQYERRIYRRYVQARRRKRFGKRRCPHLGGRSVPRLC
jgi:prophage maintenance system killer protein